MERNLVEGCISVASDSRATPEKQGCHKSRLCGTFKKEHRVPAALFRDGEPDTQRGERSVPGYTAATWRQAQGRTGLPVQAWTAFSAPGSPGLCQGKVEPWRPETHTRDRRLQLKTDSQTQLCFSVHMRPQVLTLLSLLDICLCNPPSG